MLGVALDGIPRDSYRLMSKVTTRDGVDPMQKIDELRKLARTEYFDVVLSIGSTRRRGPKIACAGRTASWRPRRSTPWWRTAASVHRLPALRPVPGYKWLQVAMIRMNHKGTRIDAEDYDTEGLGNVSEVVAHVKQAGKAAIWA